MINILFLARPGAGKGTQAQLLAEKFNLFHLSSGAILRQEVASGSKFSSEIKEAQLSGQLVSDELITSLVEKKLNQKRNTLGFVFDGFPRTLRQAENLDKLLEKMGGNLNLVIILDISREEMIKRVLKRAEIEKRQDDNEITIGARAAVYDEQTRPLIDYYAAQNKILTVNGLQEIPAIAAELEEIVTKFLNKA